MSETVFGSCRVREGIRGDYFLGLVEALMEPKAQAKRVLDATNGLSSALLVDGYSMVWSYLWTVLRIQLDTIEVSGQTIIIEMRQ
jgi:hypothetical protein